MRSVSWRDGTLGARAARARHAFRARCPETGAATATSTMALGLSFVGEAQVARRDVAAAMATAQELLALCDEHHLPQPRATALMFFGWAWRTAAMSLRVYVTLRKGSVSGAGSALAFTSRVQYACWQRSISRADAMPTV